MRIIRETRFSVHDISRVEVKTGGLLRFNIPFKCGPALGAIRDGAPKRRDFLFMTATPLQGKRTLSDLAGQDPRAHNNDPRTAVAAVRAFLYAKATPD